MVPPEPPPPQQAPPPPPESDVPNEPAANAATRSQVETPPKAQKKQPRSVWREPGSNSDRSLTPANHAAAKIFENIQDVLVIPTAWHHHLRTKTGPDDIAIALLAEIVYWFRPTADKKRKFKSDQLQRNISDFTGKFGYSRHQVSRALARLEAAGVITKELRNIKLPSGKSLGNVLFIDLNPGPLMEISTPPPSANMRQGDDPSRKNPASHGAKKPQPFTQECHKQYTENGFPETAKTERPNPKPFSGEKGFSSTPSTEPRGRADWCQAARQDPGSMMLANLFPGDAKDWPENLARMFVKRRRAGALPDNLLRLAARSYRVTNDDPDRPWKARTIREFLSSARLDRMAEALRRRIREDVQDLEAELDRWRKDEYGMLDIENIFNLAKSPDFSFPLMFDSNPALTVLFRRGTPEAKKAVLERREQIENQLVQRRQILEFYRMNVSKLPPFEDLFGMSVAEVVEMQGEYERRNEKEINDLKSLL